MGLHHPFCDIISTTIFWYSLTSVPLNKNSPSTIHSEQYSALIVPFLSVAPPFPLGSFLSGIPQL